MTERIVKESEEAAEVEEEEEDDYAMAFAKKHTGSEEQRY